MSVLCVGKGCSEHILSFLDSIDLSKELTEKVGEAPQDRPMTAKKNMELIYKVSDVLGQSLNINEILEKILEYIFDLLKRIDRGAVILIDHETGEAGEVITRFRKGIDDSVMRYSEAVIDRVIKTGQNGCRLEKDLAGLSRIQIIYRHLRIPDRKIQSVGVGIV